MSHPEKTPLLWFIGGSVRSGTTLLAGMISASTDGFNAGELHLLWGSFVNGRTCTCTRALRECPVWGRVHDSVMERSGLHSATDAAILEAKEPSQKSIIALRHRVPLSAGVVGLRQMTEDAIRKVTGADVIVDSSKLASTAVVASRLARQVYMVQLVRDPRAVAFSSVHPKPDPAMGGRPMLQQTTARSAMNWMSYNLAFERLAAGRGADVTRVRYEDLVAAPEEICAKLGLSGAPGEQALPGEHSIAGNPWRFEPGQDLRLDDRWKREMRSSDRRVVDVLTVPLRARYGY